LKVIKKTILGKTLFRLKTWISGKGHDMTGKIKISCLMEKFFSQC